MTALARTTWVTQALRLLPAPVLRALDAWSHRVAQRRAQQRREQWLQRRAASAATLAYKAKVLGD